MGAAPGSIRALARASGVPHSTLVRIDAGSIEATPALARKVAGALESWGEICKRHCHRLQQEVYRSERVRSVTYTALRGGNAPEELRQAFTEWVQAGRVGAARGGWEITRPPKLKGGSVPPRWLLGQLWNCTDLLPRHCCETLGVPLDSTFARAVRKLKKRALRAGEETGTLSSASADGGTGGP